MGSEYYMKEVLHHEWILSNKKGGYALGFGDFINDRKYNGLLIAGYPGLKRIHLVSGQEEFVEWRGNRMFIDSNAYNNCIFPEGYQHIVKTWLRPYPTVLYSSEPVMDDLLIMKEVFMHPCKNITVVRYTNKGNHGMHFSLRPRFTIRDHHTVNFPGTWDYNEVDVSIHVHSAVIERKDSNIPVYMYISDGEIKNDFLVYRNVYYSLEAARGYDATEDLLAPVLVEFSVFPATSQFIVYSDEPLSNFRETVAEIIDYFAQYPLPEEHPSKFTKDVLSSIDISGDIIFDYSKYRKILQLAMDNFIVEDNIIAGFPWFSAWGRDTFIALEALFFLPDTSQDVVSVIIDAYGKEIKHGVIPNMLNEGSNVHNYDTVDASLWFIIRIFQASMFNENQEKLKQWHTYASRIVMNYMRNKELPFFMNNEGFIEIKNGPWALTWMDAKVHGAPVTPRYGACVEIVALWYNALMSFIALSEALNMKDTETVKDDAGDITLTEVKMLARKVRENAVKFIINGNLADRIEDGVAIDEHRPNALIAIALPFALWEEEIRMNVWTRAKNELFTSYGIRSLSPSHYFFKKKYIGDQKMRDLAYHQGTVWAWLLGPFIHAYFDLFKDKKTKDELLEDITFFIWSLRNGFMKGHIASIAEVWDGEQPHFPKGCPAQAWSVCALLIAEHYCDIIQQGKKE